jgi:hypothetical protein
MTYDARNAFPPLVDFRSTDFLSYVLEVPLSRLRPQAPRVRNRRSLDEFYTPLKLKEGSNGDDIVSTEVRLKL